jgi:hypothetical protein
MRALRGSGDPGLYGHPDIKLDAKSILNGRKIFFFSIEGKTNTRETVELTIHAWQADYIS